MEPNLDGKSTASLVSTSNETADDGKGRKYYRTASRPTTGVRVLVADSSLQPPQAMAVLALYYNGTAKNVKPTTSGRGFSARAGKLFRKLKRVWLMEPAGIAVFATRKWRSTEIRFEFRMPRLQLWHAECISQLSITQASPRWLFCEPRRRLYNLSVCDSKQTVATVWRPCPSRDTARFTQPGR
jgi:hypothetical protein